MSDHHGHHADRQDLTGEHALTDIGQLVLAVLFVGAWIADALWIRVACIGSSVPLAVRIPIGAGLTLLAGYAAWASHRIIFGEVRDTPHVVRKGIFGIVRHPMYLSQMLLYPGLLLLIRPSILAAGVWLVAIGFLHVIARKEERLLIERFGDEYRDYMRDVGMWFPRLRRS